MSQHGFVLDILYSTNFYTDSFALFTYNIYLLLTIHHPSTGCVYHTTSITCLHDYHIDDPANYVGRRMKEVASNHTLAMIREEQFFVSRTLKNIPIVYGNP